MDIFTGDYSECGSFRLYKKSAQGNPGKRGGINRVPDGNNSDSKVCTDTIRYQICAGAYTDVYVETNHPG